MSRSPFRTRVKRSRHPARLGLAGEMLAELLDLFTDTIDHAMHTLLG
jgi:hypothetical protein